jgi:hypothetical protein
MWPKYFPAGCPTGAEGKVLKVYRLVDHDPPTDEDFVSAYISQPSRKFIDVCLACGLSVFKVKEEAIHQNELLAASIYFKRKGLSKKKVAVGATHPEYGQVKDTPNNAHPSHTTYWLFENARVASHFKVI